MSASFFRLGIIGGMGPMAGVLLQRLIIQATPARIDQEHLQMLCFTQPKIPDRTHSLQEDDGESFTQAIQASARVLEAAGCTHLVMPCHTAHTRFDSIRSSVSIPFLHLTKVTVETLAAIYPAGSRIGVLATDGAIASGLFQDILSERNLYPVFPSSEDQRMLMRVIYGIKAGEEGQMIDKRLMQVMDALMHEKVKTIILGCTELSLRVECLEQSYAQTLTDPLRVMAQKVVSIAFCA